MTADSFLNRVLANRYQLTRLLGKGAMGAVYLAKDQLLGEVPVAVKFLSNTLLNAKMRDRFEREATTSAVLGQRSMHIVRVMDYGVDKGDIPFYVMEYLKGDNLSDLVNAKPLELPKFLVLARQICLGLQAAHEGISIEGKRYPIVHRDVKPSNILVCKDPTLGDLVKLLDFGIAKLLQENEHKQTTAFMGTLAYSSPEQMEGKDLDNRSDIYSLGIVFFEMLTSSLPIQPDTQTFGAWYKAHHTAKPRDLFEARPHTHFPPGLVDLIQSCLAKSAADRPQNIAEIIQVLDVLETLDLQTPMPGGSAPESLQRPATAVRDTTPDAANPKASATEFLTTPASFLSVEQACKAALWPQDKPRAQVVFPKVLTTVESPFVTLCVMLPKTEILQRGTCSRYNTFLCVQHPHPMILWLTVLYNREMEPRWLPHYIDLKTTLGQKITRLLGQQKEFQVLLFPLESGDQPEQVLSCTISPFQAPLLLEWANSSQSIPSINQAHASKNILRGEYESLKGKILLRIESSISSSASVFGKDLSSG